MWGGCCFVLVQRVFCVFPVCTLCSEVHPLSLVADLLLTCGKR
jgi:hypothetical protein